MLIDWIKGLVAAIAGMAPEGSFLHYETFVRGTIAVVLVGLICGAVGAMVVGNRMAFFSDALSHCAYAGAGLGLVIGYLAGASPEAEGWFLRVGVPSIMVVSGALAGLGIGVVREKTGLASDTVIGVFFAAALGIGSVLLAMMGTFSKFPVDTFLWGNLLAVYPEDLLFLIALLIVTGAVMIVLNNDLLFTSFNRSLARSRRVPVRLCNYIFIVLLALIVNLSLRIVGVLLINALLIVPAATASLMSRNMRQMFWFTVTLSVLAGIGGLWLNWEGSNLGFQTGVGGPIIILSVLLFFLAMAVRPLLIGRQQAM